MHTDEYEISIGREISLCRKLIRRLKSSIQKREKRYGISTEGFLEGMNQERLAETNQDFLKWSRDYHDLRSWERMRGQYEEELKKLIADRLKREQFRFNCSHDPDNRGGSFSQAIPRMEFFPPSGARLFQVPARVGPNRPGLRTSFLDDSPGFQFF